MAAQMGRLELSCKLVNISIPYRSGAIVWPESNSELCVVDEAEGRIGYYMAWCNNVDPDGIRDNQSLGKHGGQPLTRDSSPMQGQAFEVSI